MKMNKKYFFIDSALISLLAASGISGFLLWAVIPCGNLSRWKVRHRSSRSGRND